MARYTNKITAQDLLDNKETSTRNIKHVDYDNSEFLLDSVKEDITNSLVNFMKMANHLKMLWGTTEDKKSLAAKIEIVQSLARYYTPYMRYIEKENPLAYRAITRISSIKTEEL